MRRTVRSVEAGYSVGDVMQHREKGRKNIGLYDGNSSVNGRKGHAGKPYMVRERRETLPRCVQGNGREKLGLG